MSEAPESPPAPVITPKPGRQGKGVGLPLWMPLVGLVVAFAFAILAGSMICPTLSALALPPDPPLPSTVATTLIKQENKGSGLDEWLYSSSAPGCQIAKFYEDSLKDCSYDPDSGCKSPSPIPLDPGYSYQVATCRGAQPIGAYKVFWTVYIATNYHPGALTQFRVIRELGN